MRVIGYTRVSTAEQAHSGASLATQEAAIRAKAAQEGWELVLLTDAGVSGSVAPENRPAMAEALRMLASGEAQGLMATRVDRLSRSLPDFANLLQCFTRKQWHLVVLDLGVDTTTPAGEMVAHLHGATAHYERRLIGQRTREVLAQKRAEGVILGRPKVLPQELRARIAQMRSEGLTLAAIATTLTTEGVPTAQGGARWYPSTIRAVLASA